MEMGKEPFLENEPIVPFGELGYYLGSKACSEILVQSYASELQVIILRPFFVYGKSQNRSMLIPRLFDNVAAGKPIELSSGDGIKINPIHVNDVVKVLTASLHNSASRTYNIGGPEILSIRKICNLFGSYLEKTPNYQNSSDLPKDLVGDISLISEVLHQPKIKLSEVIPEIDNRF